MINPRIFLTEEQVKDAVVQWLSKRDWGHIRFGRKGARGADIVAKHNAYGIYYVIEAKCDSDNPGVRESNFVNALGQIVTRIKVAQKVNYKYGIALPEAIAKIALRRIPYEARKRLSLHILSVNDDGEVKEHTPSDSGNKKLSLRTKDDYINTPSRR